MKGGCQTNINKKKNSQFNDIIKRKMLIFLIGRYLKSNLHYDLFYIYRILEPIPMERTLSLSLKIPLEVIKHLKTRRIKPLFF